MQGKKISPYGDRFDIFLMHADTKINHYENQFAQSNPYNPLRLMTEFNVNEVDEKQFEKIKDAMKKQHGIPLDDMLVVEGCMNDDRIVLGGKQEFLNHFCAFFDFNICYSMRENKSLKRAHGVMNDPELLNKKIEDFVAAFDSIK